jgi:hypothetical protein
MSSCPNRLAGRSFRLQSLVGAVDLSSRLGFDLRRKGPEGGDSQGRAGVEHGDGRGRNAIAVGDPYGDPKRMGRPHTSKLECSRPGFCNPPEIVVGWTAQGNTVPRV